MAVARASARAGVGQRRVDGAEAHAVAQPLCRAVGPSQAHLAAVDHEDALGGLGVRVDGLVLGKMLGDGGLRHVGQCGEVQVAQERDRAQAAHTGDGRDAFAQVGKGVEQLLDRRGLDGGELADLQRAGARAVAARIEQVIRARQLTGMHLAAQRDASPALAVHAHAILIERSGGEQVNGRDGAVLVVEGLARL